MADRLTRVPACGRGAAVVLAVLVAGTLAAGARADERGAYTAAQADAGRRVFLAHCARCHGPNMQGGQGPALIGRKFEHSLEVAPVTARQLYGFITSHMPAAEPGTLSNRQFLAVFAYLLERNGHPAGDTPLTKDRLDAVKLLRRGSGGGGDPPRKAE